MMAPRTVAAALLACAALALPAAAGAQSIEETYASLCKTDEQKQGESCVALRKALLEKLQAEAAPAPVARAQPAANAAPARPPAPPMDPAAIRAKWGIVADLAGRAWVSKLAGYRTIQIFEWETPGEVLLYHIAGLNTDETILTPPSTSKLNAEAFEQLYGKVMADGTLVNQMYSDILKTDLRTTHRIGASGSYEQVTERLKGGKWRHYVTSKSQQVPLSGPPTMRAAIAYFQAPAGGSSGGGGLLGALGGAALGAIAGGNTEQIVGAAMKGAAMVDPNAAALDAVGDSLIGGNTASLGSAGGLGALGGSAGGSYPTRPNALGGSAACSMMNQGNYRDVSLSGGNDVQLKTMCGQAFEYYSMYLRAIEQVYSEADANRTYDAHQQAALNAISFYENNR
jgi:hypothetical protein